MLSVKDQKLTNVLSAKTISLTQYMMKQRVVSVKLAQMVVEAVTALSLKIAGNAMKIMDGLTQFTMLLSRVNANVVLQDVVNVTMNKLLHAMFAVLDGLTQLMIQLSKVSAKFVQLAAPSVLKVLQINALFVKRDSLIQLMIQLKNLHAFLAQLDA